MAVYTFGPFPAVNPGTNQVARNATGQIFAVSDVARATPLAVRDLSDIPLEGNIVNVGEFGVTEEFRVDDAPEAVWKSGSFEVHLVSYRALLDQVVAQTTAAQSAQTAAAGSQAAAEAAQAAAEAAGGGTGVTDHGLLSGLADDDHGQYHTDIRGDVRYYTKAQTATLIAGEVATSSSADRDRGNHRGEQAISSIIDLETRLQAAGSGSAVSYDKAIFLDKFTGTDDEKLTAAIAEQKATANMPPIVLGVRTHNFNVVRTLYSGLKLVGNRPGGQENLELSSGNYVCSRIVLGAALGFDLSSWWVTPGGDIYDVFMADFGVKGDSGTSKHQFMDVSTGTLYACEFRSLSFDFMKGVFGWGAGRKCLMTQVSLTGSWTMNNAWDTQMNVGGSDCVFWMDSFCNVGTSGSAAQTGGVNSYYFRFNSLEGKMGTCYLSTLNGWRGIHISGSGTSFTMYGSIIEGYKSTRINGLLSGPGPGIQVKITGGATTMYGVKIGQGMDNPDVTEGGLLQVEGGEVSLHGTNFYGRNMGTPLDYRAPTPIEVARRAIHHIGGRLAVHTVTKRQNEGTYWTGRPNISTTAVAGTGTYTYYTDPDQSLAAV